MGGIAQHRRQTVVMLTCLPALLLSGCKADFLRDDTSHGAIAACEAATKKTLMSPASYQLVWSDFTKREPLDEKDWQRFTRRDHCIDEDAAAGVCRQNDTDSFTERYSAQLVREAQKKAKAGKKLTDMERMSADVPNRMAAIRASKADADSTGFVTLQYDSSNTYGVQLRKFGICRFGPLGDDGKFDERDIFQSGPVRDEDGQMAKDVAEQLERK